MTCSQHVVINTNDPSSLAQSDQVPAQHDAVQSHHGQWTGQDSSAAPQEEVEMIISMTHEEEMVWNTDMDSNDSVKVAEFPKLALKHGILLNLPI